MVEEEKDFDPLEHFLSTFSRNEAAGVGTVNWGRSLFYFMTHISHIGFLFTVKNIKEKWQFFFFILKQQFIIAHESLGQLGGLVLAGHLQLTLRFCSLNKFFK